MAYSKDLRIRIITAVEGGELTQAEILRHFGIRRTGLSCLLKHVKETGSINPKPYRGGRRSKFQEQDVKRIKYLEKQPDATLEEILEFSGKDASIMSVFRMLRKIGYRLKKSHYSPRTRGCEKRKTKMDPKDETH